MTQSETEKSAKWSEEIGIMNRFSGKSTPFIVLEYFTKYR